MKFDTIILEKKEGIAKITLNRPEKLNAINSTMEEELMSAIEQIAQDDGVSVVIITGAGRAFSAGRDIKDTVKGLPRHPPGGSLGRWKVIEDMPKPVIAAVNGTCYTGGVTLLYYCDIIIASEKAVFADAHARFGISPTIPSIRLPRMVGANKAKEIMLTCEPFSAQEAERIGLVNKVVPADKLQETAIEMAKKIIKNSQRSVRYIKSTINKGMMVDMETGLEMAHKNSDFSTDKRTAKDIKDAEARIGAFKDKKRI